VTSTNGHGPKRAILYTRVSGHRQRDHGYSLSDQRRELEAWAAREGYEVLEVLEDAAWSGGDLTRPGLDRMRDLVERGGVDAVVTLFRDRLARGVYATLLAEEFAEHGCKLISLNAQVDDTPEGELHGGMLDIIAAWERKKIAERTRRGKLQKARQGKVLAAATPNYGFEVNAARDGYDIDEEAMRVVRRIFRMAGVEKRSLNSIKKALEAEGVPTPKGKTYWSTKVLRAFVLKDVYKAHAYEEVVELVAKEVATRLDPNKRYGIWWYNQQRTKRTQVAESSANGHVYRKQNRHTFRPKEEWIAVPVPDPGIPREWVDAAREAVLNNQSTSSAGRRFWELSGGVFRCGGCGYRMTTHSVLASRAKGMLFYYRCRKRFQNGTEACAYKTCHRADKVEPMVWKAVSGILKDPEQLRADLDAMIEMERRDMRGNPDGEIKRWVDKLVEVDRKRVRYQEMAAADLITFDELRTKLQELDQIRKTAECELKVLHDREEYLNELEKDRDALLDSLAEVAPDALDSLTPEERHQVYKMLRLKVVANLDGSLEMSGAFGEVVLFFRTDVREYVGGKKEWIDAGLPTEGEHR